MSEHDDFERDFWGDCTNTYGEETKQLLYLREMGFSRKATWRSSFVFDGNGKSYVDLGGGPTSALLKFENRAAACVIDPMIIPGWVADRYLVAANIGFFQQPAETLVDEIVDKFDIALIYNCLQHCENPAAVIENAKRYAKALRVFEWINIPPHQGHPHMLTASLLREWTGYDGRVAQFGGEYECYGTAWILSGGADVI